MSESTEYQSYKAKVTFDKYVVKFGHLQTSLHIYRMLPLLYRFGTR